MTVERKSICTIRIKRRIIKPLIIIWESRMHRTMILDNVAQNDTIRIDECPNRLAIAATGKLQTECQSALHKHTHTQTFSEHT